MSKPQESGLCRTACSLPKWPTRTTTSQLLQCNLPNGFPYIPNRPFFESPKYLDHNKKNIQYDNTACNLFYTITTNQCL